MSRAILYSLKPPFQPSTSIFNRFGNPQSFDILQAERTGKHMDSEYRCSCGRLWRLGRHSPDLALSGRMSCHCGDLLRKDEDGSWHADLIDPVEKFVGLRRIGFAIGVMLLKGAVKLSIPLAPGSWLRPHKLAKLRNPNRALHARVQTYVLPR